MPFSLSHTPTYLDPHNGAPRPGMGLDWNRSADRLEPIPLHTRASLIGALFAAEGRYHRMYSGYAADKSEKNAPVSVKSGVKGGVR